MKYFEADPVRDRYLAQERFIFDTTEKICEALQSRGLTRRELANRVGVGPGEITQRLNGTRNLTLRTVADMLDALGYDCRLEIQDRRRAWQRSDLQGQHRYRGWGDAVRYTTTGVPLHPIRPHVPAA